MQNEILHLDIMNGMYRWVTVHCEIIKSIVFQRLMNTGASIVARAVHHQPVHYCHREVMEVRIAEEKKHSLNLRPLANISNNQCNPLYILEGIIAITHSQMTRYQVKKDVSN